MTKSQSIQTASNWAWTVRNDPKAPLLERMMAQEALTAIEGANDSAEVAYDALAALLKGWVARRKESMSRPIQRLSRALRLSEESTVDG